MFDLDAYLARISVAEIQSPRLDFLQTLHLAHLAHIPFENIDVRLRRPIGLDPHSLHTKLVARRRGGYCFEHNTLFAAALRALGFTVETLEARVRPPGASSVLPRTHMTLRVQEAGQSFLADVGFGGNGPLLPVPLDGTTSEQPDASYRVESEGEGLVLRRLVGGEWQDLYAVSLVPALPVDFEVANHFTSTHPSSPFLKTLTVQQSLPEGRRILRGHTLTVRSDAGECVRQVDDDELPGLLREVFGLDVADEEARRAARTG